MKSTQEEAQHTPTPWRTDKVFETLVQGVSGDRLIEIASTECGNSSRDRFQWDIEQRNKANAAFIVRCCNNFEESLELLHQTINKGGLSDEISKRIKAFLEENKE